MNKLPCRAGLVELHNGGLTVYIAVNSWADHSGEVVVYLAKRLTIMPQNSLGKQNSVVLSMLYGILPIRC